MLVLMFEYDHNFPFPNKNIYILDFDLCMHELTLHLITDIYKIDTLTHRIVDLNRTKR